ncbi:hypothetical protein PR048_025054 [Dryococelus australis]|uniref:BTB domain-containing protein n=1 Tax=Dryococelus australis TaxID=614101 RepID=A0ABQ9GQA3_9NEOP|nr:hypothetical protein PR048_025054 [Dryococelus australis]
MKGQGKLEILEKTCRPIASSGTIPTCENPVTWLGIEPGSPWQEVSVLIAQPPWLTTVAGRWLCWQEIAEFWTAEAMLGDSEKIEEAESVPQEDDVLKTGDDDNVDDGGDEGSHFCLKWKHHQNNQRHMFSLLLNQEAFCDVTLACEGQLIEAHKTMVYDLELAPCMQEVWVGTRIDNGNFELG